MIAARVRSIRLVRMAIERSGQMPSPYEAWKALLAEQAGVVHRRDIPTEFMRETTRDVRARRWQRIKRDVFVAHNGPLSPEQREWVVLNAAPPGSALSGLTAATIDGFRGFVPTSVHVTMPCGSRSLGLAGVSEHFSRFLATPDVHPLRRPTRTRLPRSLLDAASWSGTDGRARAVLLAGVQQGLVTTQQLAEALPSRGPCLRHRLISETITDAAGGIESVPEQEFAAIVRRARLPEPARQRVLRRRDDGRFYLDADWEEYAVCAEVDGRGHLDAAQWEADVERANEIVLSDRLLLRFTSFAVRNRPNDVIATLTRALISRGWRG